MSRSNVLRLPEDANLLEKRIDDFNNGLFKSISEDIVIQDLFEQLFFHIDHRKNKLIGIQRRVSFDLTDLKHLFVDLIRSHVSDARDLDSAIVQYRHIDDL